MNGLEHFARQSLGISLYPGQRAVLKDWEASGKRKAVLALGRRSGKGLMAAIAAIKNAAVDDYTGLLRPGEQRFVVVVATRIEQAREFIRAVRELLEHAPDRDLTELVDWPATTLDEVVFKTGVTIRALPCSARSTRGLPITLLVLDECAHMITTEDGPAAGDRVYQALAPSTAQFGQRGYIMLTSTPLWSAGIFWRMFVDGTSGAAPDVFVVQRPTWEVNRAITRASLESEFRADPDSARVEYGAEFAEGAGAFLSAAAISDCVVAGRKDLPPVEDVDYVAAADPAFAAGGDAFTFAIAHRTGATVVIDRIASWRGKRSPLNSDVVLDEIAEEARRYGVNEVTSDQYAVIPLADGMRRRGVELRAQPLSNELKADIYTSLKRAINNGEIELPDNPQLVAELVHLQVRPTPSGKPRIGAAAGYRDDLAMVVATVVHAISAIDRQPMVLPIVHDSPRELLEELGIPVGTPLGPFALLDRGDAWWQP